jgi:hypothetical protein
LSTGTLSYGKKKKKKPSCNGRRGIAPAFLEHRRETLKLDHERDDREGVSSYRYG